MKKESKRSTKNSRKKSEAKDREQKESHCKIDIPLEVSAIKPKRLDFLDDFTMKTAASNCMVPDFDVEDHHASE